MTINNFELIRNLLRFDYEGDFYFLQILKRRKDNPDLYKDMIVIHDYFIYSLEEFDKLMPRIIEECTINNARAYFRLNRRNAEKVALQTLRKISELLINHDYKAAKNAYASAAGEYPSEPDKTWVVDLDFKDEALVGKMIYIIETQCLPLDKGNKIVSLIPTKNGFHLISRPFNQKTFKEATMNRKLAASDLDKIDIHKDNPTILYVP